MALTDAAIRAAKPAEKLKKISDGGGLQLWISPSGTRLWYLAYRYGDKQKKLALGAYPAVSLAAARKQRDEAKAQLASGVDPGQQKKANKIARALAEANTFDIIADELIARKEREGKAEATVGKVRWLLSLARPALGKRPVSEVTAPEILVVLRKLETRGNRESAKRLRAVIGEVFRYAIATARATNDPTQALRGALLAPQVKHRPAITTPAEFGQLLRAIDGFKGQPTTVAALKLMPILFPRPGELRKAEWSEFDLDAQVWNIPASRTKMRRPHRVPLPWQAIEILRGLHAITGNGRLVFPGISTVNRPISENTLNAALRRLGYGTDEMCGHGFRATASTLLNESGKWSVDAIEHALAHQDADAVRRAYARGEYWDERVRLMQWWADKLDTLRDGAVVVKLRG